MNDSLFEVRIFINKTYTILDTLLNIQPPVNGTLYFCTQNLCRCRVHLRFADKLLTESTVA